MQALSTLDNAEDRAGFPLPFSLLVEHNNYATLFISTPPSTISASCESVVTAPLRDTPGFEKALSTRKVGVLDCSQPLEKKVFPDIWALKKRPF
jgi:hypothetical protein